MRPLGSNFFNSWSINLASPCDSAIIKRSSANAIRLPVSTAFLIVGVYSISDELMSRASRNTLKSSGDRTLPYHTPVFGSISKSPIFTFWFWYRFNISSKICFSSADSALFSRSLNNYPLLTLSYALRRSAAIYIFLLDDFLLLIRI